MKKYFVSSDIHGFFTLWYTELIKTGFEEKNPDHILIILGDLLDRGHEPNELIDYLLSIPNERLILIKGNHEDLLDELIERKMPLSHDFHNKTINTLYDLAGIGSNILDEVIKRALNSKYWILRERMVDYYELDEYIFVHGWIPVKTRQDLSNLNQCIFKYNKDWRNASKEEWIDARWLNGMYLWYNKIIEPQKIIVCGHYRSSYGNHFFHQIGNDYGEGAVSTPFIDDGIMAIDASTASSGTVNIIVIEK